MTVEQFQAIRKFSTALNIPDPTYKQIKDFLNNDWFKQFIWMQKGLIRLNPLDFTTEEFLSKNPAVDDSKAKKYNEYIDAVIEKYIKFDTTGKIDAFKKCWLKRAMAATCTSLNNALMPWKPIA